jgi:hypothetical protein
LRAATTAAFERILGFICPLLLYPVVERYPVIAERIRLSKTLLIGHLFVTT